ncbi:MAG: LysR substrate-binding domain-containing protein [Variibacter sp.]
MDTRYLEVFRAVMEHGSMTAAGHRLGRSQSAISQTISRLEDEVGMPLFRRQRGKLQPLPEAVAFYEEVSRALKGLERTVQAARDIRRVRHGPLVVATQLSVAISLVPRVIASFLKRHPGVLVRLLTRNSQVVHDLQDWEAIDLGFAEMPPQYASNPVDTFDLRCVCVLSPEHPAAVHPRLSAKLLDGVPFIALHREHMTYAALKGAFAEAGAQWNVVVETEFFLTAGLLTLSGAGVALVDPITALDLERRGLAIRPFDPAIIHSFGLFHPKNRVPSIFAKAFAEIFTQEITPFTLKGNVARGRRAASGRG